MDTTETDEPPTSQEDGVMDIGDDDVDDTSFLAGTGWANAPVLGAVEDHVVEDNIPLPINNHNVAVQPSTSSENNGSDPWVSVDVDDVPDGTKAESATTTTNPPMPEHEDQEEPPSNDGMILTSPTSGSEGVSAMISQFKQGTNTDLGECPTDEFVDKLLGIKLKPDEEEVKRQEQRFSFWDGFGSNNEVAIAVPPIAQEEEAGPAPVVPQQQQQPSETPNNNNIPTNSNPPSVMPLSLQEAIAPSKTESMEEETWNPLDKIVQSLNSAAWGGSMESAPPAVPASASAPPPSTITQEPAGLLETKENETTTSNNTGGGPMWSLAEAQAGWHPTTPAQRGSPRSNRFAESLKKQTQSRAQTDMVNVLPAPQHHDGTSNNTAEMGRSPTATNKFKKIDITSEEAAFLYNTALAQKRVKVVQLLLIGLFGMAFGFLGSFFTQSSCHLFSAQVQVGGNAQTFSLHYGLWKYSPMDSVFMGYSYCAPYDDEYTADAPLVARWLSCIGLFCGSFALMVLWYYLLRGRAWHRLWMWAVYGGVAASILQFSTLSVLQWGDVCQRNSCSFGPAMIVSIIASFAWLLLAIEMYYHRPTLSYVEEMLAPPMRAADNDVVVRNDNDQHYRHHDNEDDDNPTLMGGLELQDWKYGAQAYIHRWGPTSWLYKTATGKPTSGPSKSSTIPTAHHQSTTTPLFENDPRLPTLNRLAQKDPRRLQETILDRADRGGTYQPPPSHLV